MPNKTGLSDEQAVDIVKKKKRNRPDLANFGQEYVEPGDNAKYISFAMASFNAPPVDMDKPEEVQDRINWYLGRCAECDMKPGIVGLANALGVSRKTLWTWKAGTIGKTINSASLDLIKKAYNFIEEMWEDYMLNGKAAPPNLIFLGKNHYGYTDTTEVVVTPNNPLQNLDEEAARKRIIDALPEPDETE